MGWLDWAGPIAGAINPVVLGSNLLAGGLDYIGSQADRRSVEAANASNRQSQEYINSQQLQLARENMDMQREFAKMGIRWRVEDAEAAGLHPMAALGASGAQASPAHAVMNAPMSQPVSKGDSWRSLSNMGQNIGRAVMATQTASERAYEALRLVNMQKQNDLLTAQSALATAEANSIGKTPPMPSTGQWMQNRDGSKVWVPSNEYAVAANALPFAGMSWYMRNKLMPYMEGTQMQESRSKAQIWSDAKDRY